MHILTRRRFLGATAAAAGSLAFTRHAFADGYPTKPVRYIVGFAPGGTSDLIARLINPAAAAKLGQPLVIENLPSAGGVIAMGMLANSAPDGYTVMHTSNAFITVTPQLMKVPYDPMKDVEPVAYLGSSINVLCVNPSLPVKTVPEFIAYAKANPGKLFYGSSGTATGNHITCEYMKRAAGFDATHVPYKGAAPAINDLMGGRVQFMADPALLPHIQSGKVRAIGIVDAKFHPMLPGLPAVADVIPNWDPPQWYNFISVTARTPPDVKEKISRAIRDAVKDPATVTRMGENSFLAGDMTPDELSAKLRKEYVAMGELLRSAQIRLE
jgi:tripartite-type tricarboxylate transporter receptor subunit TctC